VGIKTDAARGRLTVVIEEGEVFLPTGIRVSDVDECLQVLGLPATAAHQRACLLPIQEKAREAARLAFAVWKENLERDLQEDRARAMRFVMDAYRRDPRAFVSSCVYLPRDPQVQRFSDSWEITVTIPADDPGEGPLVHTSSVAVRSFAQ